jgi:malonyl-CoA/methylmalonyl-CoA synthetase
MAGILPGRPSGCMRRPGVLQTSRVRRSEPPSDVYTELFGAARRAPDRRCLLLEDGTVWTYGEVDRRARQLGGALVELGIQAGDRVVVQVEKSPDSVCLYLACLLVGAVYVPLNTAYTPQEVSGLLRDAGAATLVGRPGHTGLDPPEGRPTRTLSPDGSGSLQKIADRIPPLGAGRARSGSEPAAMLYTSGTTGRPKGAVLSCRNLVSNARALHDAWRFRPEDVLLHVLPVFHVHGLFVALHCAFLAGATVRFHGRFDSASVRRELRGSTVMMGVPTMYHRLLEDHRFGAPDCTTVRLFTSGSAPLRADQFRRFEERTGHRIVERYGTTETMILTSNPYEGERVPGTVGHALAGVELRVVDEMGRTVAAGERGTVEARGPGVFLGYHGQPGATAAVRRPGGWFVTGDIGSLDATGRLTLAGRASDTIISGGLNVYPKEVEQVLDAVAGVLESAVVGVPDDDLGEAVIAAVVTEPGRAVDQDELRRACRVLAAFKRPRRYVELDRLPRNAMGKVSRPDIVRRLAGAGPEIDRPGRAS